MFNESWVEKFRPKKLDDVISHGNIISSLKNVLKKKNVPHLLFFGPSGCGKTSTILALCKELFGAELWEDRVIELNASDERGIKVVRDKIRTYALNSVKLKKGIPPWKIIILDEADNMTSDSQFALRKIMEDYSKVTRFCIICNYHHKIIDPIVSRCHMYRFNPISIDDVKKKLTNICKSEQMYCSENNINNIIKICRGDLRKAVNLLQKCKKNKSFFSTDRLKEFDTINEKLINEISGIIDENKLIKFIDNCLECNINLVNEQIDYFYNNSYSLINQIELFTELILKNIHLTDERKSKIIKKIVQIDQSLIKGCDEYIQYYRLSYYIMSLYHNKK